MKCFGEVRLNKMAYKRASFKKVGERVPPPEKSGGTAFPLHYTPGHNSVSKLVIRGNFSIRMS